MATVRNPLLEAGRTERGWLALVYPTVACRPAAGRGKRTVVVASNKAAAGHRLAVPCAPATGSGKAAVRSTALVAARQVTRCQAH